MAVCKFFLQGNCKFGSSCRFDHPSGSSFSNNTQSSNRFGALSGGGSGSGSNSSAALMEKYRIDPKVIRTDLTTERPQWILSAYAPGRDAPDQLFGGYPREQSFEEMRIHYLQGAAAGKEAQALAEAQELYQNAEAQIQNALSNVDDAARFVLDGEGRHPNRHDLCKLGTEGAPFGEFEVGKRKLPGQVDSNPFGQAAQTQSSSNPFGQPSSSSSQSQSNPFGQPSTSQSQTSTFGQPSTLGQKPNPFGTPTFGQPSQPTQPAQPQQSSGGFGQPAFGQPSQPTSTFGQPSQLGAQKSAFGQPSQLGAQSSPFGQPSQPSMQGSAFGQPSQMGQKPNPFGSPNPSSPFGGGGASTPSPFTPANNQTSASPFAQPGTFGQPVGQTASPFGQPTTGATPAASNPFASSNTNGFGQSSQSTSAVASNPFGQPSKPSAPAANPFAQTSTPAVNGTAPPVTQSNPYPPESNKSHPPLDSYSSRDAMGQLKMFKGRMVVYRDANPGVTLPDGTWKRIWFPGGPPNCYKATALPTSKYDAEARRTWDKFAENGGVFEGGVLPDVAPPRECTRWDF